jgi:phosphohistidine swiveling domain-containing protein
MTATATTGSERPRAGAPTGRRPGMVNPLHWSATEPDVLWSTGNVSEAIPGVSTALNWSFIDDAIELAARRAFCAMGVLRANEVRLHDRVEDRLMTCFYGRTVANIDAMRTIGDRMPGTSANAIEEQLFGVVRPNAQNHNTLRRMPAVIARMPRAVVRLRSEQLRLRSGLVRWWRAAVLSPPVDRTGACALLEQARERYTRAFELATVASMLSQALYDQVVLLAKSVGPPGLEHRLVTGYSGMLETGLVSDLWSVARADMDLAAFLLRHGFHGPGEGQMDSHVWREDPVPLLALVERYQGLSSDAHPAESERRQQAVRVQAEAELLAATARLRRPRARLVLGVARGLIPQREVGKANYTQCLDGARLAARVIGSRLAAERVIEHADDVFHLTYDELVGDWPDGDLRGRVQEHRALREDYLTTGLADRWTGPPTRVALARDQQPRAAERHAVIEGEAVGGGTVVGRVRIVVDPTIDDLEPGEILVCRTTDPGWVALFHLAGGIAVDMGGQMSHGAIVARELGLPCVTCTVDATRRLRTGDLVRLDGDAGRIEILKQEPVT